MHNLITFPLVRFENISNLTYTPGEGGREYIPVILPVCTVLTPGKVRYATVFLTEAPRVLAVRAWRNIDGNASTNEPVPLSSGPPRHRPRLSLRAPPYKSRSAHSHSQFIAGLRTRNNNNKYSRNFTSYSLSTISLIIVKMSNAWNNQQWNGSRVPPMHGGSQVGWETDSDRSVSPPDTPLESLPFRKRYTRSHEPTEFGPSSGGYQSSGSGGFQGSTGFTSNPSSFTSTNGSSGYSSSSSTSGGWNSSTASSGYSSSEDDKLPVDYSKPRDVVRAGVIRHSSNPRMCLAYYYLPK